jgi:hypothetical protein
MIRSRWHRLRWGLAMMGRLETGQERLLYNFRVEDSPNFMHVATTLSNVSDRSLFSGCGDAGHAIP